MRLKKEQRLKLNKFPNLYFAIESFIRNKGCSEEYGCIPHFTWFFKQKYLKYNIDPDDMFKWSKGISQDFWSWGSNSRWAHVATSYIHSRFNTCVNIAIELAEEYVDLRENKE